MKTGKLLAAGALAFLLSAGLVEAKIPVAPMDDAAKAKAEEVKAKAAETAKKEAELLGKAQDRVATRYIKDQKAKGVTVKPTAIAAAAAAKPAAPAKK